MKAKFNELGKLSTEFYVNSLMIFMTEQLAWKISRYFRTWIERYENKTDIPFVTSDTRIKKMKNLIETLNRPEEHMTIYRTDGSFVSLKYENSQVTICDSREKNVRRVVEADNFIRDIMRE